LCSSFGDDGLSGSADPEASSISRRAYIVETFTRETRSGDVWPHPWCHACPAFIQQLPVVLHRLAADHYHMTPLADQVPPQGFMVIARGFQAKDDFRQPLCARTASTRASSSAKPTEVLAKISFFTSVLTGGGAHESVMSVLGHINTDDQMASSEP